jgi:hypothetical protein
VDEREVGLLGCNCNEIVPTVLGRSSYLVAGRDGEGRGGLSAPPNLETDRTLWATAIHITLSIIREIVLTMRIV